MREVQQGCNKWMSEHSQAIPAPQVTVMGDPRLGCVVKTTWPLGLYSPRFWSLPHADAFASAAVISNVG
jgi:hypothetical protein